MALRNRTEYSPTIQWSSPLLYVMSIKNGLIKFSKQIKSKQIIQTRED